MSGIQAPRLANRARGPVCLGRATAHVRVGLFDNRSKMFGRPSRRSCAMAHELLRTRAEIVEASQRTAALILRSMRAQARVRLEGWPQVISGGPRHLCALSPMRVPGQVATSKAGIRGQTSKVINGDKRHLCQRRHLCAAASKSGMQGGRLQSRCKRVRNGRLRIWGRPVRARRLSVGLQYVINVIYAARSSMRGRRAAAHMLAPLSTP